MKVAAFVPAIFALMLPTCAPVATGPCQGSACARGSTTDVIFDGFEPASYTAEPTAPIALDSSDGNALALESIDAQTVIDGPLAFTELHLSFKNDEDRLIEGRFRFALPPRASVSRFAMKIQGRWQEAEVVERARATEVYETFLHQRVDPALLEQGAGNELGARVYPVFAKSAVELVVSYSQELSADDRMLVPLEGLGKVGKIDARVMRADSTVQHLQLAMTKPEDDWQIDAKLLSAEPGLRSGDLVLARVRPRIETPPEPLRSALFLVDTSASRALDLDKEVAMVRWLAQRIAARQSDARVAVACFDQQTELVYAGRADGLSSRHLERMRRRRALGASDLEGALGWARGIARKEGIARLVLVSDGVATAGRTEGEALRNTARALGKAGIERLDAVAVGGIRDDDMLASLVDSGLERDGVVIDGTSASAQIWRKLNLATRSDVKIEVADASWWYPTSLDSVQPGDEALVYAEVPAGKTPRLSVGGATQAALELRGTERPLLERALSRAKIAALLERERRQGASEDLRRSIVELSKKARVLSPYTSLLVLEQEWHYQRFGIDRQALTDILTVRDGKIAVLARSQPPPTRATPTAAPIDPGPSAAWGNDPTSARGNMWGDDIGESFGSSGLGLTGTIGRGAGTTADAPAAPSSTGMGFGSGHGRLGRTHTTRAPQIRMGATSVSGRLPPEAIQRIVRQNFGRFRGAYQRVLVRNPRARGRVVVRFVIARDGSVSKAEVTHSEIGDATFGSDIVNAFQALTFPVPEGGIVTVSYPILFTNDEIVEKPLALRPNIHRTPTPPPPPPLPKGDKPAMAQPHTGKLALVMQDIARGNQSAAIERAARWQGRAPGDVLALVALGEALEAAGHPDWAARAYGSIVDLFPTRADLRRFAAGYLERVKLDLAIDSYDKALEQRPDHPSSYRLLAFALVKQGRYASAFETLENGLKRGYTDGRFRGAGEVLREDIGLVAAAWIASDPSVRNGVEDKLDDYGARLADDASLRFVLTWETDTNDVDLHVYDASGHAYHAAQLLPSGGSLLADVTTGFGPELFAVNGRERNKSASRYRVQAHYYARGPMGYGMGKLEVVHHDGHGKLRFEERPFVIMVDDGYVDFGDFSWAQQPI